MSDSVRPHRRQPTRLPRHETLNTMHGMLESMGHKDLDTTWRLNNNTQCRCPWPCGPAMPEPTACWTLFSKCHCGTCTVRPILVISSTKRGFRVAISQSIDTPLLGAWKHASYSPQFISPTRDHLALHQVPRYNLFGSDGKESACNAGHLGSIPGSGRSPGEGNDNSLSILAWRIP